MPLSSGRKVAPHLYTATEMNSSEATLVNPRYNAPGPSSQQAASDAGDSKMTWKKAKDEEKARINWEARMVTKLRCILY